MAKKSFVAEVTFKEVILSKLVETSCPVNKSRNLTLSAGNQLVGFWEGQKDDCVLEGVGDIRRDFDKRHFWESID